MSTKPKWLDPREDRAWRAFKHALHRLDLCLQRDLLQDSGLTQADYEILAVLSQHRARHPHRLRTGPASPGRGAVPRAIHFRRGRNPETTSARRVTGRSPRGLLTDVP
jgi:hypothetical protein